MADPAEHPPRPADNCIMVIFGASGDLTTRKLLPALYNLGISDLLPHEFAILGFAKDEIAEEDYRKRIVEDVHQYSGATLDHERCNRIAEATYYMQGDFSNPADYARLQARIAELEQHYRTGGNVFYYFATLPQFFPVIVEKLGAQGLVKEENGQWRRVVFEKPFGSDLESAKALNAGILKTLAESQIYRIDHYLGKETVQNLLIFRFSNGIFEPIWNRRYIDHVQITVAESLGVERRGGYYEHAGALRDMIPNHILQLVSLTAMEPPISFDADAVRDEQAKVLHAITPMAPEEVLARAVRGQYGEGQIAGEHVPAYRSEPFTSPTSNTETFVALKLGVDNWRWADVPFYVRTGKRMAKRSTEIVITARRPPLRLFRDTPVDKLLPNRLTINIQPDEGISLQFGVKQPGANMRVGSVNMDFRYSNYFGVTPSTGYERLLYDCMTGDATLFQRADMVEAGWTVVQPIIDVWRALPARNFPNYASGSWGPKESEDLLHRDNRVWNNT
jgi:glucose-6-phosphate 1-dehydrogenase